MADPAVRQVKDLAGEGRGEAQNQAEDAQAEATEAQTRAGSAAERAMASLVALQATVGAAVGEAVEAAGGALCLVLPCDYDPNTRSYGHGPHGLSSQSSSILPLENDPALGLAMVVAAGAVGGAVLWFTVLQRGIVFSLVPLLSRIAHSEIYTNDARRLIAQIASENPGLCLNEIVARTGYSRNAVSYHLFVLEKEEELVSVKDGKYRRYFSRGGKYVNGAKQVVSVLRNETTLKMAQHIVSNPGTIQREICQVLGTTASAACWHAKRLEQMGVIRKERVANTVKYFPGDELGRHDYSEFGLAREGAPAPMAPLPALAAPL